MTEPAEALEGTLVVVSVIAPNRLREERVAAGIATSERLAVLAGLDPAYYAHLEAGHLLPTQDELQHLLEALGGIEPKRVYAQSYRQMLATEGYGNAGGDFAEMFEQKRGAARLLVAKDEVTWLDRRPLPDRKIDVFLSMSCGTQESPHLLLDTIAVYDALGVAFVGAAGAGGCCGKPFIASGQAEAGERWVASKLQLAVAMGAKAQVNWCTACQITSETTAARRAIVHGEEHPLREVQILTHLSERIEELGDRVPWNKKPQRRVLAEGHKEYSPVHANAQLANARLLSLIPGVEMVGLYDGFSQESPCGGRSREEWQGPWTAAKTVDEIQRRRAELADVVNARGADTVACQHQGCHQAWGPYASERLAVKHAVSILAEALGVDHPDRHQAAVRLADAGEIVEQTRPVWMSWGMEEAKAREIATKIADPRHAAGVTACSGGCGGQCSEELIGIDILTNRVRARA